MRLPNSEKAVVEIEKLRDYCLNPSHPRGKHKARVFESTLGYTSDDAETLQDALRSAAASFGAELGERDGYGQRYTLDFPLTGRAGTARIRSSWIVRTGEDFPRLTSCYVL